MSMVCAGLDVQPLDLDLAAELDAVLLAAGFDDCVHDFLRVVRSGCAPRTARVHAGREPSGANDDGTR